MPVGVVALSRNKGFYFTHLVEALNIIGSWIVAHEVLAQLIIQTLHIQLIKANIGGEVEACSVFVRLVGFIRAWRRNTIDPCILILLGRLVPHMDLLTRCFLKKLEDVQIKHLIFYYGGKALLAAASDHKGFFAVDSLEELLAGKGKDHGLEEVGLINGIQVLGY